MSNYLRAYGWGDSFGTAEGLWARSLNPSFEQILKSILGIQVML